MIEMLGVLAIIGVLSAGGIMGYSAAMENYKVNKTLEDINTIVANMEYLVGNGGGRFGESYLLADQLLQAGVIPQSYAKSLTNKTPCAGAGTGTSPCLKSHFSDDFFVRAVYINTTEEVTENLSDGRIFRFLATGWRLHFNVQLTNLPYGACVKLAMHKWGDNYDVKINTVSNVVNLIAPLSSSQAEEFCKNGGTTYLQFVIMQKNIKVE